MPFNLMGETLLFYRWVMEAPRDEITDPNVTSEWLSLDINQAVSFFATLLHRSHHSNRERVVTVKETSRAEETGAALWEEVSKNLGAIK